MRDITAVSISPLPFHYADSYPRESIQVSRSFLSLLSCTLYAFSYPYQENHTSPACTALSHLPTRSVDSAFSGNCHTFALCSLKYPACRCDLHFAPQTLVSLRDATNFRPHISQVRICFPCRESSVRYSIYSGRISSSNV